MSFQPMMRQSSTPNYRPRDLHKHENACLGAQRACMSERYHQRLDRSVRGQSAGSQFSLSCNSGPFLSAKVTAVFMSVLIIAGSVPLASGLPPLCERYPEGNGCRAIVVPKPEGRISIMNRMACPAIQVLQREARDVPYANQSYYAQGIGARSIVWLGKEHSTELSLVGGKGASLSTLQSVPGIRVPEGFIITTEFYQQFVEQNPHLARELDLLDDLSDKWLVAMALSHGVSTSAIIDLEKQISDQSVRVRERFFATPLDPELSSPLIVQYQALSRLCKEQSLAVAIRSSATAEDLPHASFAGQHDSFINQRGEKQVLDAVVACWASLFHPHTVQYRNQLRFTLPHEKGNFAIDRALKHSNVRLAIVVQRSLPSAVAGVGFNVNPLKESKIHIEANYGFGETVVSGMVSPDSWETTPDAQVLLSSIVGNKQIKGVVKDGSDIELVEIPEMDRCRFVLNEDKVMEIASSIRDIGAYYKRLFNYQYIDTEFAVDTNGVVYFVQARPETVFSSSSSIVVTGVPRQAQGEPIFHGGATGYPGAHTGRLVYAKYPQEALEKIRPGDILLTSKTTPEWTIVFPKVGGIIVDVGGVLSHTAIVGRERRIPTLLAAADATLQLASLDGAIVTLDSINAVVFKGALETVRGDIQSFVRPEFKNSGLVQDLEMQIDRIDGEGKWRKRFSKRLTTMQIDFVQKAYAQISEAYGLDEPIRCKVVDQQIYVQIVDADGRPTVFPKVTEILIQKGLGYLEEIFRRRVETVEQLQKLSEHFEPTADHFVQFIKLYQAWMFHYLSRGRFGHGAVATLMQQQLEKVPDQTILSSYLNMRYPMPNESHEKQVTHAAIAKKLQALGMTKSSDLGQVRAKLQREHPGLWQEIIDFAQNYEHTPSEEDLMASVPLDHVIQQLVMTLGEEEVADRFTPLTGQQIFLMDTLFAQHPDLARTMILAHRHLYQKENEHHLITRSHHRIRQVLLQYGKTLVEKGILTDPVQLFDHTIEEILSFLPLSHEKSSHAV